MQRDRLAVIAHRPPLASIALLTASSLAYEILLMHLYGIIQYQHFAAVIISLALLGYGMSGTFLALARTWLLPRYRAAYVLFVLLFSVSASASFLAAQTFPFNGEELLWDPKQTAILALHCLLIAIPFFFAANAVGLTLYRYEHEIGTIYAYDLAGAGIGSICIIALLYLLFPGSVLLVISVAGCCAALLAARDLPGSWRFGGAAALILASVPALAGREVVHIRPSAYKSEQQYLRLAGTEIIASRSSPLGVLTVMRSERIPFRYVPGLSLNAGREPLPQLGVFTNADNLSVITRFSGNLQDLVYLDETTSALPYHLQPVGSTLILGSGGGSSILQALYHRVPEIHGVELNPQLVELLRGPFSRYSGRLLEQPTVHQHVADIRQYVEESDRRFDLVQLELIDSFGPSASGLQSTSQSYLYTVEAVSRYLERLSPHGYLCITRWLRNPPRDSLKILATAREALQRANVEEPGRHLLFIRSWQTGTILVKKTPFTAAESARARTFCRRLAFDIAYGPRLEKTEVNRYNILPQPLYYQAARALTGDRAAAFVQRYKFDIRPATDDRPFFHHFFKWSSFREIIALKEQGGIMLLEYGYLLLAASLLIASAASLLLIVAPLLLVPARIEKRHDTLQASRLFAAVFAAGLGFIMVELSFIQRFTLFLHHPVYAVTAALASFLVWAGLGSRCCPALTARFGRRRTLALSLVGIGLFCAASLAFLGSLFASAASLPLGLKIALSIVCIAPLAWCMGIPFPLVLGCLAGDRRPLIPWAWAVNGCGSVVSGMLSAVLAIHFGFSAVIAAAVLIYASLWFSFPDDGVRQEAGPTD